MKHLFAAIAICATTSTQYSEAISRTDSGIKVSEPTEIKPDFSSIKIDHARKYIEIIYPFAKEVENEHGVPACVTMAIACLESGYGRSYNAKNKYNHLGIRVYQNGKPGYRRFSSTEKCFEYYSKMFTKERYLPLQEIEGSDPEEWITGLHLCGYNHRVRYIKKIMQMIKFIHLDELEKIV